MTARPPAPPPGPGGPRAGRTAAPLLSVRGLSVALPGRGGLVPVVAGLDLDLAEGEALGLVGESGSGKTTTLRALLRLLPGGGVITGGQVIFGGEDLAGLPPRALRSVRGGQIGVIWQDPLASLDPVMRVGEQVAEAVAAHQAGGTGGARARRSAARARALDLLRRVELPDVARIGRRYPHELSGGQRQRVVIASAIAAGPRLLLADEPTTALDVTVQAQILALLARLRATLGLALLLVTHDLAVVAQTCERVAVMYAGRVVETGPAAAVFGAPRHHYTAGLIAAAPSLDRPGVLPRGIPGAPAAHVARRGCAFAPRCPAADGICRQVTPELAPPGAPHAGTLAACHHPLVPAGGSRA